MNISINEATESLLISTPLLPVSKKDPRRKTAPTTEAAIGFHAQPTSMLINFAQYLAPEEVTVMKQLNKATKTTLDSNEKLLRKGQENALASTLIRQMLRDHTSGTPFHLPPELIHINKDKVHSLDLDFEPDYRDVIELKKLFPNVLEDSFNRQRQEDILANELIHQILEKNTDKPFEPSSALLAIQGSKVRSLNIYKYSLTQNTLQRLAELFPNIKMLQLKAVPGLTDSALTALPKFKQVRHLSLAHNPNITGASLKNLSKSITHLSFNENPHLNDEDLVHLYPLKKLRALNLSNSTGITGSGFTHIPESLLSFYCTGIKIEPSFLKNLEQRLTKQFKMYHS